MIVRAKWGLSLFLVLGCCGGAAAQERAATSIAVALPADAQLWVNDRLTNATGDEREFRDSQAQPGEVYRYVLRATVERGGRRLSQDRLVRLAAGETARITFDFPNSTVALKPKETRDTSLAPNLLAQNSVFQRSQFQPRPAQEDNLPELPPIGASTGDGFQPRTPEDSEPADSGLIPSEQPELPELGDPVDDGRFGRQFGEEPSGDLTPSDSGKNLPELPTERTPTFEPTDPVDPMQVEKPAGDAGPAQTRTKTASAPFAAYIGHHQQHHLLGDTGTALHVWNHAWRMVKLQRANDAGPYVVYNEVDHQGFAWAYGLHRIGCDQFPVFFRPGPGTRWLYPGNTKRVRPISH